MVAPSGDSEQVRYDIAIEATQAIRNLRTILKTTEDNTTKMQLFSVLVLDSAQKWGMAWQKALGIYETLNKRISKREGSMFGQTGGQNIPEMVRGFLQAKEEAINLSKSVDTVSQKSQQMGSSIENSSKRAVRGLDAVRIAMGAIVAMIVFRAIQAVQDFFSGAINQARQFEETLYRLRNVEETLSMQGIEISMQGLKKGIQDIQKLLPIFSKEDVSQLVGTLAISTKQLGLNEEQILNLAKAIGILNIRSEKQEDISTTAQHVLSSLLTGNAKGITALGIAFTDNVMKAKAMELGFLDADEAVSKLTENEKGLTKLNIILESTANETANISEYLDTNSAKIQENSAAWKDLQTTIGQVILPFIPALTEFFKFIRDGFNGGKVYIIEFLIRLQILAKAMEAFSKGNFAEINVENFKKGVEELRKVLVNEFFKEIPEDAPRWFMQGWGKHIKQEAETATSGIQEFGEAVEDIDLSELEQDIQDLLGEQNQDFQDLTTDLNRRLDDLNEEYRRKQEDAERDYLRDIQDINRDAERDLAELREEHRQEDERSEEEYQLRLWELRQRFLMNLEDALHARDARQVLRLQREYAIDKEALARRHALEEDEREQNQQDEIDDVELRRQRKLADARLEYEQKLADLNVAKQREISDLQTWYNRELADLQQNLERKAQALIEAGIREKTITEANAASVYGVLLKYFGPGGLTDELYSYMTSSLMAQAQNAINVAAGVLGSLGSRDMSSPIPIVNSPPPPTSLINQGVPPSVVGSLGFAEGGTLLATRPTKAVFGEGGPELVNFTPLNRIGKNINKIFGDRSGIGGMDGTIRVVVDLSPDLEGRIVERSMNNVGQVLAQVNRSK